MLSGLLSWTDWKLIAIAIDVALDTIDQNTSPEQAILAVDPDMAFLDLLYNGRLCYCSFSPILYFALKICPK